MKPKLTTAILLEGLVRAIHSARVFLADAIALYNENRFASAYIIGIISVEQLGRANWMLRRYDTMIAKATASVDCDTFRKELRNVKHLDNLRGGILAISMNTTPEMLKLTEQLQTLDHKSTEFAAAAKEYRELYAQEFEIHADRYHRTREVTQYANPDKTCASWTSPLLVKREEVRALLSNAGAANRVMFLTIDHRSDIMEMMKKLGILKDLETWRDTWLPEEWKMIPTRYKNPKPESKP